MVRLGISCPIIVLGWNQFDGRAQPFFMLTGSFLGVSFGTMTMSPASGPQVLRLQTIKTIIDSRSFKSPKSDKPRRVQVLDLYCLTRFESESSSKGIVY